MRWAKLFIFYMVNVSAEMVSMHVPSAVILLSVLWDVLASHQPLVILSPLFVIRGGPTKRKHCLGSRIATVLGRNLFHGQAIFPFAPWCARNVGTLTPDEN